MKVDDKPETKQTPIAPETTTTPDEKLHDGPDDDANEQKQPPTIIPSAPDKPTPPAVKEQGSGASGPSSSATEAPKPAKPPAATAKR